VTALGGLPVGERWCPLTDRFYPINWGRLPKVRLHRHAHRCADGTTVTATAQYLLVVDVTMWRYRANGESLVHTTVRGQPGEPDWSLIDPDMPPPAA
jgi:hypothetical protein